MTPEEMAALHARAMLVPRPWSEDEFTDLISAPGAFWVGDTTGFALGRVISDEAELLTLAVDPALHHRGIGSKCLAAFEAEARVLGATRAHLEVAVTNSAARALYVKAGWSIGGVRKGYYRAKPIPIDAITMSKVLESG